MRHTLSTRQAQLFMGIHQTTLSKEWADAAALTLDIKLRNLDDYRELQKDKERWYSFSLMCQYLEGIGVLVREDLVNVRLVTEYVSGLIMFYWESFGPVILEVRKKNNFPRFMIETEYLYDRVREYAASHPELQVNMASALMNKTS
jgi:hypothetical protein